MSLPGDRYGGMLVYPRYLTLEFRFLRFLRAVVLEACKEIQAGKEGRTEGRVQIAAAEDEANQKSTERFLTRGTQQLLRSVYSIEPAEGCVGWGSRVTRTIGSGEGGSLLQEPPARGVPGGGGSVR